MQDRSDRGVLLLVRSLEAPLIYVIDALREQYVVTPLVWQEAPAREWEWRNGRRQRRERGSRRREVYGREYRIRPARSERDYPSTITVVSPRLLWRLMTAPEDVVLSVELNVATLLAVMSKVLKRRKVVVLIEGDLTLLGATGSAKMKQWLRRIVARFVDGFISNSPDSTRYLVEAVGARRDRIVEGWWLAGLPKVKRDTVDVSTIASSLEDPLLLTVGQLIPRKGVDLLLDAVAQYNSDVGACRLRVVGDGPERARLERQAAQLNIADRVEFVESVPHERLADELRSCDLFVFPTLCDLVGRVAVEALSVGTPVAASCLSGVAGVLVSEGSNGVVMDPRRPSEIVKALHRALEPAMYERISAGARHSATSLSPEASASIISGAVSRVAPC